MIDDGLEALRAEIGLGEIASLVERTARWVAPRRSAIFPYGTLNTRGENSSTMIIGPNPG